MMHGYSQRRSVIPIRVAPSAEYPLGCLRFTTEKGSLLLHNVVLDGGWRWIAFSRGVPILWRILVFCVLDAIRSEVRR